jgi:ComF family protein
LHSEWLVHSERLAHTDNAGWIWGSRTWRSLIWRRWPRIRPGQIVGAAFDMVLPPGCLLCATPVDADGLLCGTCFGKLSMVGEPCCGCCGAPFEVAAQAVEGNLCQRCVDVAPPFERARAALNYDAASRRLVLPFKHGDRTEIAVLLARLMARAGGRLLRDADLLVPVPLHRLRLFKRRYNQSALLATQLGRLSGRDVLLDALSRGRATRSLDGRSAAERRDEVAGAFAITPGKAALIEGRAILLVDDVMTSGATVSACAEVLLAGGASSVDVLAAVRVPDPRVDVVPRRRRRRRFTHVARVASSYGQTSPGQSTFDDAGAASRTDDAGAASRADDAGAASRADDAEAAPRADQAAMAGGAGDEAAGALDLRAAQLPPRWRRRWRAAAA